jgi:magnesium-protoporphyrin IX monomethyl ester (oxidative) cyclase
MLRISVAHERAKVRGGPVGLLLQGVHALRAVWTFGKLFMLPVKSNELPQQVRMVPVW